MADNLSWRRFTGFPGFNATSEDSLIENLGSSKREGLGYARSLIALESHSKNGNPVPDLGYAKYNATTASQGLGCGDVNGAISLHKATAGVIYKEGTNGSWTAVWNTGTVAAMHTTNPIRMAYGFEALFVVDGTNKPRAIGWNYDADDPTQLTQEGIQTRVGTVNYLDTTNEVCEILNTGGALGTDFAAERAIVHLGRLVLIKGCKIRMSAANTPCVFYDPNDSTVQNGYFSVSDEDGEPITNATSFDGTMLVVGKPSSVHAYTGNDPSLSYNHVIIDGNKGLIAPDSLAVGNERVWGCSKNGPWMFSSSNGLSDDFNLPVRALWESMSVAEMAQVIGWFEDGRYHLVLPIQHTEKFGTVPSIAMMRLSYDPVKDMWSSGWGVLGTSVHVGLATGDRYMLTHKSNIVWKQRSGTTLVESDGTTERNQVQVITTGWMGFQAQERNKWMRRLHIRLDNSVVGATLEYGLNYEEAWTTIPMTVPSGRKWGDGKWGEGKWVGPGQVFLDLPMSAHAKVVRFRIKGTGLVLKSFGIGFSYEGV